MWKHRTTRDSEVSTSIVGRTGSTPYVLSVQNAVTQSQLPLSHQAVFSEGHPHQLLGRYQGNIGGPFANHKVEIDIGNGDYGRIDHLDSWSDNDGVNSFYFKGRVVPLEISQLLASQPTAEEIRQMCPVAISDVNLDKYGATAISLCAPRSPLADASSTIGELKDGLPHIPTPTGNIGGEYLNIVFGIQPIASELSAYYSSWRNAEKLLDQLEKDSGKWIRRGFKFDPIRVSASDTFGTAFTSVHSNNVPYADNYATVARTRREVMETRIWFSGAFTYHLPKSGWRRKLEELDYLYGFKPGVDTAWELMPWSWMVDWYSNVGDVLHNVNAFTADGLVMPYGYIMVTQRRTVSFDWTAYSPINGVNQIIPQSCAVTYTTMQRRPANPFGFGLSFDALSGRQLAILAALGISRT